MDFLLQRFDFSWLLDQLDFLGVGFPFLIVSSINAHTSGVIATVLQAMQTFDKDLKDLTASARHVIIQIRKDAFRERKKVCFFILDRAVKSVYLQIQQLIQKLAYGCSAFQFIHQHYTKYNIRYRGYYVQQFIVYPNAKLCTGQADSYEFNICTHRKMVTNESKVN